MLSIAPILQKGKLRLGVLSHFAKISQLGKVARTQCPTPPCCKEAERWRLAGYPGGRGKQTRVTASSPCWRENACLSLLSSGLRDAVGPQTGTSLLFKSTCFTRYNMEEPGRQDAE